MGFTHIAHNCDIADHVVIANNSVLAGYVSVGWRAFLSSSVAVHQFARVGQLAMVSSSALCVQDVAPFCIYAEGDRIYGPNVVGLRRAGYGPDVRNAIKKTIKTYFFSGLSHQDAIARIQDMYPDQEQVRAFVEFATTSKRGLTDAH